MAAPSLGWNNALSVGDVNVFAWAKRINSEFAASHASISLVTHPRDLTVYLVIKGVDDILVLNFGTLYFASTYRRWGTTILTFINRHEGDKGLVLFFPTAAALERFEENCDRMALANVRPVLPPPSLHELIELGIISVPRIIGDIMDDAATAGATSGLARDFGGAGRSQAAFKEDMEGDLDDDGTSVVQDDGASEISEDGASVGSDSGASVVSDGSASVVSDGGVSEVSDDGASQVSDWNASNVSSLDSVEFDDMAEVLADIYSGNDVFDMAIEALE